MALTFELVADFDGDRDSAESCREWLDARITTVHIDQYSIDIHPPFISSYPYTNPVRFQVAVIPANIGCGVAIDGADGRVPLTETQLSRLGTFLYDTLCGAPAYRLAMVGWNVDFLLDVDELAAEWAPEIADGSFSGLVVCKSLLRRLPRSPHFVEFDAEHVWIPYTGSKAI